MEATLVKVLSEDQEFFDTYKQFLIDVKQARQDTLDQIKTSTVSSNKFTKSQNALLNHLISLQERLGPSMLAYNALLAQNLVPKDANPKSLTNLFYTLQQISVLQNKQIDTDLIIPIEFVTDTKGKGTRSRQIGLLNDTKNIYDEKVNAFKKTLSTSDAEAIAEAIKNNPELQQAQKNINFISIGNTPLLAHPHWENIPEIDSQETDKLHLFKGDRVITFKTREGGLSEARFELDLIPLGRMNLKALDYVFQWLEMGPDAFKEEMRLLELYQGLDQTQRKNIDELHRLHMDFRKADATVPIAMITDLYPDPLNPEMREALESAIQPGGDIKLSELPLKVQQLFNNRVESEMRQDLINMGIKDRNDQDLFLTKLINSSEIEMKKKTVLELHKDLNIPAMEEIYRDYKKVSEQRIAAALVNLSMEPIEELVKGFENTRNEAVAYLRECVGCCRRETSP